MFSNIFIWLFSSYSCSLFRAPSRVFVIFAQVVENFDSMGLKDELLRGVYAYGFERPSAVQQRAVKPITSGRDVIAQSQVSVCSLTDDHSGNLVCLCFVVEEVGLFCPPVTPLKSGTALYHVVYGRYIIYIYIMRVSILDRRWVIIALSKVLLRLSPRINTDVLHTLVEILQCWPHNTVCLSILPNYYWKPTKIWWEHNFLTQWGNDSWVYKR